MKNIRKITIVSTLSIIMLFTMFFSSSVFAACPGDGPAKPVSSVKFLEPEIDDETNHVFAKIEVMGYGTDYVYINGSRVRKDTLKTEFIIKTCNGADGFVEYFDCGPATKGMVYQVDARFVSHNWPYTSKSASGTIRVN